jgi:3-phosphoshikimate 1-carboxyvinyltransferase
MSISSLTLKPIKPVENLQVCLPGSKSYTIRALLLAAMTPGLVTLKDPLFSDDTKAMMACLNTLGIRVSVPDPSTMLVEGDMGQLSVAHLEASLDCDLSAASLRFLVAFAAVLPGTQVLYGKNGLNKRPIRDLVDSLRALGADIDYTAEEGYPPVRVKSSTLKGKSVSVRGNTSSQYLSALMMIAPAVDGLTLTVDGELISRPYVEMTAALMAHFGVQVEFSQNGQEIKILSAQSYASTHYHVEGDASAAAYPLGSATLTGQSICLENLPPSSTQADMQFLHLLEKMGNRVRVEQGNIYYDGVGVQPMTCDMSDCPDQAQTMAVLLSFAQGTSRIEGLRSLRVKETDRLAAVSKELTKMGILVEEEAEALVIHGGSPSVASIATYGDHRMAMAFAVAGTRLEGLQIEDPGVVAKTYPEFWQDCPAWGIGVQKTPEDSMTKTRFTDSQDLPLTGTLIAAADNADTDSLLGKTPSDALEKLEEAFGLSAAFQQEKPLLRKIVLIGFMGSGKSSVARLLAKRLDLPVCDTDDMVLEQTSHATISELFAQEGETRFRELELGVIRSLQGPQNQVIATGGGVVMNNLVMDYLSQNATVIHLEASLETILSRIESEITSRPLLQNRFAARSLFGLRASLYQHYSDLSIVTDAHSPDAIVDIIVQALNPQLVPHGEPELLLVR